MLTLVFYRLPVRAIDALIERTQRLAARGRAVFIVVFAILALIAVNLVAPFVPLGAQAGEPREDLLGLIVAVSVSPLLETVVCQSGIALMTRAFGGGDRAILFTTSIPFALLHLGISIQTAVATFILGVFLALAFVVWSRRSLTQAYWTTAAVHALYNLIIFAILSMTGSFHPFE